MPAELSLVRTETVADTAVQFTDWLLQRGISASSAHAYCLDVAREGLTATSAVRAHEAASRRILESGLAASTRARRLASCSRFFDFAHPDAQANPYRVVRRPRTGVLTPPVVTTPTQGRDLVEWFLARGTYPDVMYAASAALMAGGGLRVGEVCSLTWDRIDREHQTVRVTGKGDKTRDVPLGSYVMTVLSTLEAAARERGEVSGADNVVSVGVRSVQRAIAAAREAVGVPGLHPHALRHGFGTTVQESHGDLRLTADLLGHASISTTTVYAHVSDVRRRSAVEQVL